MPDRRHLWRGIHDPDMVRSGLDIALAQDWSRYAVGDEVRAVLTVTASRVGHYFSREIADTRIPPGGRASFEYRRRLDRPGLRLRATVTVYPDHFYTGFFRSLLNAGAGRGEPPIREALEATRRSPFDIFDRELPLT